MCRKSLTSKRYRKMRLGYNTNGFAHHRLEDALVILAELGYSSVAITLDHGALNPYDPESASQCERVRRLLEQHHLRCVIESGARFLLDPRRKHQPTLLSATAEERDRRRDFHCRAIGLARVLNADAVSFWSGTPADAAPDEVLWNRLVDGCRALGDVAARQGVRLAFEPEPGMFIDTMPKFAELHRRVDHPQFGLTLDVGHLHCLGEQPVVDHLRRWQKWLWNIHIEDMRRGVHDHLMFGEGEMDFPPIFRGLEEIVYEGGVHVELSRHSHDAVNTARIALEFLRDMG
jgi:L-ribulose-5-phosphate 3-epimerase